MELTHPAMLAVSIVVLAAAWLSRNTPRFAVAAGTICWIVTAAYFIPEAIAIAASPVPFNPLFEPISALGVTSCGETSVAGYEVCSPLHEFVNWVFLLNGLTAAAAAILLHRGWPRSRRTVIATASLVVFGLSNAATAFVPADVDIQAHVLISLPGMFAQIPALLLLATVVSATMPRLARWTYGCAAVTTVAVVVLLTEPWTGAPGGAAQRLLYLAVWVWGIVIGVVWWRRDRAASPRSAGDSVGRTVTHRSS